MARPKDFTVTRLAELLGVTEDYARKLLSQRRHFTPEHMKLLEGKYGGKLEYLANKYGMLADLNLKMLKQELGINDLIDLSELMNKLRLARLATRSQSA